MDYIIIGAFLTLIAVYCFATRPNTFWHTTSLERCETREKVITVAVMSVVILICTLPMSVSPIWNGLNQAYSYQKQYENMAQEILQGRIHFNVKVPQELLEMDNPYDFFAREELGIKYLWDHAFYNGKYYMYFGIVPVLILFLPYLVITGTSLATYRATQIFVCFAIIAIFYLFRLLSKAFFKNISFGLYLFLSTVFSIITVCYSIAEPVLYCTAIASAVCLELWSLAFFVKAVWLEKNENRQILFAALGSLFGALTFGCRPTVALANILVLPMLIVFLRNKKFTLKLFGKLTLAALPYVAVGVGLMIYNYVRFESPFEFGQSYQLTVTDQTSYLSMGDKFNVVAVVYGFLENFLSIPTLTEKFPYIQPAGVFINFPIFLLIFMAFIPKVFLKIKEKKLILFIAALFAVPVIISLFTWLWSPYLLERYRMDLYFSMGILCFMVIGLTYSSITTEKNKKIFSYVVSIFTLITGIQIVLYLCSFDFVKYIV